MSANPETPARRRLAWPLVLLGLIALAVLIFILVSPRGEIRDQDVVTGEVPGGTAQTRLRVSEARPLAGTNLVAIEIGTGGYGGGSYDSGSPVEQRNFLLLDRTSGAVRRLLPDNGRAIQRIWFLPAQANYAPSSDDVAAPSAQDGPPPAFFVLLVAQAEPADHSDLLVGSLAGPAQRFVMQGIDGVDAIWMQSATQVGLLVRERQNLFYRIVDIPTLRVVQQHRVAI